MSAFPLGPHWRCFLFLCVLHGGVGWGVQRRARRCALGLIPPLGREHPSTPIVSEGDGPFFCAPPASLPPPPPPPPRRRDRRGCRVAARPPTPAQRRARRRRGRRDGAPPVAVGSVGGTPVRGHEVGRPHGGGHAPPGQHTNGEGDTRTTTRNRKENTPATYSTYLWCQDAVAREKPPTVARRPRDDGVATTVEAADGSEEGVDGPNCRWNGGGKEPRVTDGQRTGGGDVAAVRFTPSATPARSDDRPVLDDSALRLDAVPLGRRAKRRRDAWHPCQRTTTAYAIDPGLERLQVVLQRELAFLGCLCKSQKPCTVPYIDARSCPAHEK